ncbi:GMC family oxidoreductase [Ruegeria sp. 2205SS24-7]|uniref:FAD-dependent oxidoreductase n=1 Tax=Ruegeria discodermiae TaxID=3064389 RepID=UPI002740D2B9|nr:GMC family oxidoreductase [Ruegeria sp. 2205SS24-7]MDP5218504.1 GMC family oxidoreductase [Ruegeria sp. 2205SS24-7]
MDTDVLIIGSGMGGATCAAALAPSGARITILERGERIKDTADTRDAFSIFNFGTFRNDETWDDSKGNTFNPGNYYFVGGNSKLYGAVMFRYRSKDFCALQHMGGTSPGWPISYEDFEPWYQKAEDMYEVRGSLDEDPTEPPHSGSYAFPPVPHEPAIADAARRLAGQGLTPAHLPLGVDIDAWLAGGATPWDAFPNTGDGKKDAESVGLKIALRHNSVRLETGCKVTRLLTRADGQIEGAEFIKDSGPCRIAAKTVVLSAGAVNSAALLLRSANDSFPTGLANRSDQVGRNFMNHNTHAVMSLHPFRKNPSVYQKTLCFNDFYLSGGPGGEPLGNIQLLGKITAPILASQVRLPGPAARWLAGRSIDWYLMSEDLPDPESRVTVRGDRIVLDWKRSNWEAHLHLLRRFKSILRKAGWPLVLSRAFDRTVPSHQCGTARFGTDPDKSVLDIWCRTHDHPNLFVVDASFLPNSAAVNPALTIAAQALRVADHIKQTDLAA